MHAHAHPIVWEIRVYSNDPEPAGTTDFDKQEAKNIIAVCLARSVGTPGEYFISMMHGSFGHKAMTAVLKEAKKWGATKLWFTRHKQLHSLTVR